MSRTVEEPKKSHCCHLIDRLIHRILTLPISSATTEKAFSVMKILATYLVVYIKKEVTKPLST